MLVSETRTFTALLLAISRPHQRDPKKSLALRLCYAVGREGLNGWRVISVLL
eukprot:m.110255 g.110255  ORF g.110255 m.110255 type:complete len:52 (-) comp12881_c0_seq2:2224-2379(-)